MLLDRLRAPDAQLVDGLATKTHDGNVIWHGEYILGVDDLVERATVLVVGFDMAAETDLDRLVRTADLPRVPVAQPFVGVLDLASVDDILLEEAIAVTHAVAVASYALVCHGVEEAGCQTAETAISQSGIGLLLLKLRKVDPKVLQALVDHVADPEVQQVVVEKPADEEFDREVVDALLSLFCHACLALRRDVACL